MPHPLVIQLRFTRSEFLRALEGVTAEEGARRFEPMNSIAWMIGHLAWHERLIWLERAQGLKVEPALDLVASGLPASTPPLADMWAAWQRVVDLADPFLDALTTADLERRLAHDGRTDPPPAGTQLQRITYHYWCHIGEASAVRQMLGHRRLAQFVGDIDGQAPFRREPQ